MPRYGIMSVRGVELSRKLFLPNLFLGFLLFLSLIPSTYATSIWSRTYGGAGDDWACSVIQASDGGYAIAGTTNSFGAGDYDFWLVKTTQAIGRLKRA